MAPLPGILRWKLRSNSNPDLLVFDPEIERTLRRARQVRRRIEFENFFRSQTETLATENISIHSSDSDSNSEFERPFARVHAGNHTMAEPPRVTLRQMGGASMALEN
ncbi:hypothetical protein PIB30_089687 [Stylosanthes scabra]|uniref:Uncharacterized protein n=1 Tax=Stylosanthes scabra TaxID=79078 RepID=A0ABU6RU02_9FABA|nr:hypothetical protein [Stylosanthes scabra]